MAKSVCIIAGDYEYENMFVKRGWKIAKKVEEADLVQFTGGADIYPPLYGEKNTGESFVNKERDLREMHIFHECIEKSIPMAGICRGGQFLNVMNGGRMHQDVRGHGCYKGHKAYVLPVELVCGSYEDGYKDVREPDGCEEIIVTSTHHQMFIPHPDAILLMYAQETYVGGDNINPEALYYKRTNCLCFQPHPEFSEKECTDLYFSFIGKYLGLAA